jgi:luciferase family oxidoreductase group 1
VLGLPFSFAHHFAADNTLPALAVYRRSFRPSETLSEPYSMIGVSVIVGESDEHADWLAGPSKLAFVRRRTGKPSRLSTPEEAAEYQYTPMESELLRGWGRSSVVGGPERVARELGELAEQTAVQELMVLTSVFSHADRVASYERLMSLPW